MNKTNIAVNERTTTRRMGAPTAVLLRTLLVHALVAAAAAENVVDVFHGRSLLSTGCQACCYQSDCRLAYSATSPGICCGTYPRAGCCPLGSSCINCGSSWRCTNSRRVTSATRNSVCRAGGSHYGSSYRPQHGSPYGPQPYHQPHYDLSEVANSVPLAQPLLMSALLLLFSLMARVHIVRARSRALLL